MDMDVMEDMEAMVVMEAMEVMVIDPLLQLCIHFIDLDTSTLLAPITLLDSMDISFICIF